MIDEQPKGGKFSQKRLQDQDDDMNSSVILDLNPEKYEKPKDYLFFDFFSMYTKNFVQQKKKHHTTRWPSSLTYSDLLNYFINSIILCATNLYIMPINFV